MFSVVIPLYNKELSIKSTIQSVLDQTYRDFELIIVNDGSTDKSLEVVQSFDDKRIRIINKENGGVSSARNKGIKEAKHEWIALLDGDDIWFDDHLTIMSLCIKKFQQYLVFCTSYSNSDKEERGSNSIEVWDNYFEQALLGKVIWTSVLVINKKCFDEIGFFNEKIVRGEDIDVWIRLGKKYSIIKSNRVTAIYRLDSENRATQTILNYEDSLVSILSLSDTKSDYEKKYIQKLVIERFKIFLKNGNFKAVLKTIKKHGLFYFFK